jgi:lauroyl/myristoyl acyltransferase
LALQDVINGLFGVSLAYGLAQALPPRLGHWTATRLGGAIGRLKNTSQAQAVRANQWVVSGGKLSGAELDSATRAVFRSTGRCQYDYYHHLHRPEKILKLVEFNPAFEECIQRSQEGRESQLLVIPHFSNFDLVGRAAALKGMRYLALSYPQPQSGYQRQNEIRNFMGLEVTPISNESLRQAAQRLRGGGTVLTGADRPLKEGKYRPQFFGRAANLPTSYVRLALKEKAAVIVVSGISLPDGRYQAWASEPVRMEAKDDLAAETLRNTEAVLEVIEDLIRQAPQQWSMFYPVWPEATFEIPS